LDETSRTLTVRFEFTHNETAGHAHTLRPGSYATVRIEIPPAEIGAVSEAVARNWAEESALENLATGGAGLGAGLNLAANLAVLRQGRVLAVPDSAVIDTGDLKIVYREAKPGEFDGVKVRLGPRMTQAGQSLAYYPVLQGLQAGDKVVTNGSFLIDAETRLNPAAGSIYYGGGGGGKSESPSAPVRPSTPSESSETDKSLIAAQKNCPITGKALGSMGAPDKITLKGRPVYLCCSGCEDDAKANTAATLKKVDELKAKVTAEKHNHP
jgi:hypothetical protein